MDEGTVGMSSIAGDYTDWRQIEHRAVIPCLIPQTLVQFLVPGQTALDIGCSRGAVSFFLARHGLNVVGIDINAPAIADARQQALSEDPRARVRFEVVDILDEAELGTFDVVVMIRLHTCFAKASSWRALLNRAYQCVSAGGVIYVHDFLMASDNENYRLRYQAARDRGWRNGNFVVDEAGGRPLFIAHHHSKEEVDEITAPYQTISLQFHQSLSRHGNVCSMFEFLGRKPCL
jgi:SAM-dependent methyltransferase